MAEHAGACCRRFSLLHWEDDKGRLVGSQSKGSVFTTVMFGAMPRSADDPEFVVTASGTSLSNCQIPSDTSSQWPVAPLPRLSPCSITIPGRGVPPSLYLDAVSGTRKVSSVFVRAWDGCSPGRLTVYVLHQF
jgi:hypothetical protein